MGQVPLPTEMFQDSFMTTPCLPHNPSGRGFSIRESIRYPIEILIAIDPTLGVRFPEP